MSNEPPKGQRYTHLYVSRGEPVQDSPRFRLRLAQELYEKSKGKWFKLAQLLQRELGIQVLFDDYAGPTNLCKTCDVRDLLDTITITFGFLGGPAHGYAQDLPNFVRRALAEENLGYRIDEMGGIHPVVDVAFEAQRMAVLAVLSGPRYNATLQIFEGAHEAMERDPPSTKDAVRGTFGAVENLFKLMTAGQAPRLGTGEATKFLTPILDKHYPEATARKCASPMLKSFCDWIDAAHWYRHEPGQSEPAPPPMDLCVALMSAGTSYLRWLAEIDPGRT